MNPNSMWLALSGAAEYIDVSTDTISRRAVEWPKDNVPVPGKVRYKYLTDLPPSTKTRLAVTCLHKSF
jgi:hypothetical protein